MLSRACPCVVPGPVLSWLVPGLPLCCPWLCAPLACPCVVPGAVLPWLAPANSSQNEKLAFRCGRPSNSKNVTGPKSRQIRTQHGSERDFSNFLVSARVLLSSPKTIYNFAQIYVFYNGLRFLSTKHAGFYSVSCITVAIKNRTESIFLQTAAEVCQKMVRPKIDWQVRFVPAAPVRGLPRQLHGTPVNRNAGKRNAFTQFCFADS